MFSEEVVNTGPKNAGTNRLIRDGKGMAAVLLLDAIFDAAEVEDFKASRAADQRLDRPCFARQGTRAGRLGESSLGRY